jgi:hypothetical protein
MKHTLKLTLFSSLLLAVIGFPSHVSAVVLDNGVDPANLGKGDWIYFLSTATNKLGGHVTTVKDIPTLMAYEKSQGMDFIIVKAGEGSTNFPTTGAAQFTSNLCAQAHAAGLLIFGYTRSYGSKIPGEIGVITNAINKGADGYVIDAEVEWESSGNVGGNGPALAIQLCSGVKNAFPTRFLAHAPMPIISLHSSFPYKQFGLYCDAVMPQDYWFSFGQTPGQTVDWMDTEWRTWQNSLSGSDTNSIKPIVPVGQADSASIPGSDITAFVNYLNSDTKCVTKEGYHGVTYWRADLHTTSQWTAIAAGNVNWQPPSDGGTIIDNPSATVVGSWTTASLATDKFGADYRYNGPGTGTEYLQYTPSLASATTYVVSEWHSQGANRTTDASYVVAYNGGISTVPINQQINGGKWNALGMFNFLSGSSGNVKVTDAFVTGSVVIADAIKWSLPPPAIIVDNPASSQMGTWSLASSAPDKFGADYRFKGPGSGSGTCMFIPNFALAGNYQVYEWHSVGGNRTTAGKHVINYNGGKQTVNVNQTVFGGQWNLLGTWNFAVGSAQTVTINDNYSTGSVIIADAIKFVFVSAP